jgi:hypothetical protein
MSHTKTAHLKVSKYSRFYGSKSDVLLADISVTFTNTTLGTALVTTSWDIL